MISKRYGDTILYWGHRVLVRYTDGTAAEGLLAPDERGIPCLDGSPLDPDRTAELRMIGVCSGPADRDGSFLLRSLIHGRGAYRFPADDPGALSFLDKLRDGQFLCEADAVLTISGEGQDRSITAGGLHLRSVRPQVRSGDFVKCSTEDGTDLEGVVLAVLDDGFILETSSSPQVSRELVSFDGIRDLRINEGRRERAAAEGASVPESTGGEERIGLLLFVNNAQGFIGTRVQAVSGRWIVPSPVAFFHSRGEYAFDQERRIYAVRYTLPDPAAEEQGAGTYPPALNVVPLTGKAGRPLSFLKDAVSEVFLAERGQSVPADGLHETVHNGAETFVAVRSRYRYDPRFMAGELTGKPVFARIGDTGETVCGRLNGASPQGIVITTLYDRDGRSISFSDLTELRCFGHITALTGAGGTIDGRFRFRMDDLHSDWDRDTSRLKPGAAMSFRLARPASSRNYVLDDVMCMEETEEIRYAAAALDGEEKVFRFGRDPRVLCGEEGDRNLWLPWDSGAVYEVLVRRASGRDYPEVEWLDSYARFIPQGAKDLHCRLLSPLPDGREYAVAWRTPGSDSLTLTRLAYFNSRKIPARMISAKADSDRFPSVVIPSLSSLGQPGGSDRVSLEMFQSSKKQTLSSHRFLISYAPLGPEGIEPGSLEVLQSYKYPALAGFRYREDGTVSSLVLCTDDSSGQSRPYLLNWAFSRTELGSFSKEAAAFRTIRADNVSDARALLDGASVGGMSGLRLAAAAKLRLMIWNQTSDWDDRAKLKPLLSPALNVIGRIRGQGRSLEQQEWSRFHYMLSLRVDPRSRNAYTGFFASLAYQQDPRRFSSLFGLETLEEVTAAIVRSDVSDRFMDAMAAGSMMLFVPMPFENRDSSDSFREFVDPEAGRKTMAAVIGDMDRKFHQRYRESLRRLLQDPGEGTTEDLIRQAVEQCNAFRDFFAGAYTARQYEDELDRRLADPRSALLLSVKNHVSGQFRTLLERMHETAGYDIFPRRKACFDRAIGAWEQMDLHQYTCLYQYLFLPARQSAGSRLSYAMKKYSEYSRPVLSFGGCDVIGTKGDLLHLRVSILYPETSPMRQNAENISLRLQFSEEYEILPNEDKDATPPTERSAWNASVKDAAAFDLQKIPAGRSETGIDFLVRPKDPDADRWTLKASAVYGWSWSPDAKAILDAPGAYDSDSIPLTELSFSRPRSAPSLDRKRVGLFQAKFDGRVEKWIRELEKRDPSDPQIPALRNILLNRHRDVEEIAQAFCDPVFSGSLIDEARLVILQGQWRVGKSTVLNRIGPRIRSVDPEAAVILMDLPFVNRQDEAVSTFSRTFARGFLQACERAGVYLLPEGVPETPVEFSECRRLLSRWMKANPGRRIVLLLDEFTHLYADMRIGLAGRADLKELVTFLISDEWKLLTVAVGGEFTARMLELLDGNTIQKMPKIVNLQYLEQERVSDFARFVIGEDRFLGTASAAALNRLYELTRGNMFLLQEFCADLIRSSEEGAKKRAQAGGEWDEDLVFTNRWIDRTIRRVASGMTDLEKKHRFDFLWNPFNEDENGGDVSAPDTVFLLENERVFEDYRNIFRGIIETADGDTHTFQREALKQHLTAGETPVMTPEVFEERFTALLETRRVLERVKNSELCCRISVDLCFLLLYLSK